MWICLADLLYFQDSVDHYEYIFEFSNVLGILSAVESLGDTETVLIA